MPDTRHRDIVWNVGENPSFEGASLAVLMDIRAQLQRVNALLACPNFQSIPGYLQAVAIQTRKPKRKRKRRPKP